MTTLAIALLSISVLSLGVLLTSLIADIRIKTLFGPLFWSGR